MILYKHKEDIQRKIDSLRKEGKTIGFVPTMGALHEGHLSLIKTGRDAANVIICSIFVNPTQFNDPKDFEKYPVTLEADILKLAEVGTDILFLPAVEEMYPGGTGAIQHYELGNLENVLEGRYRPGHFQGVCNVVHRLFKIIQPDKAFFGQKDYQQCMVIEKLVTLENLPVDIVIHPTVRESSGLAMSSRNLRLSSDDKEKAIAVYQSLLYTKENVHKAGIAELEKTATDKLSSAGFEKIDYVSVCDAKTLQPLQQLNQDTKAVVLIAAFLSGVRLIDNMIV